MAIEIPLPIEKGGTGQAATGVGAFSAGSDVIASGQSSIAIGYTAYSIGDGSISIGVENYSNSNSSVCIGNLNSASAETSLAFGYQNQSNGISSSSFGINNIVYGTNSSAFGNDCYGGGTRSSAFGYDNTVAATGTNSSAFGYGANVSGANASAFGYFPKTTVNNTLEVGYWPNASTRGGGLRADSSGTAALTYSTSSTQLTDGGATAGSEAVGSIPRGMAALRHDGDGQTFLDLNDAGAVETKNLTSVFGQATSGAGSVAIAVTGTYYKLTTAATLDSGNTSYMALNSGQITLQNTSGYTRRFLVTAYINASSNNQKRMIGLRIGKNGTSYAGSESRGFTDDTDHPTGITSSFIVSLVDDEYADIYVANHTNTDTVTINAARISAYSID